MRWRVSSGVSGVVAVVVGGTEGGGMERSTSRSEDCSAAEVSLSSASATASASDAGGSERLGSDDSVGAPSAASSSSAADDTLLREGKRRGPLLFAFGWRLLCSVIGGRAGEVAGLDVGVEDALPPRLLASDALLPPPRLRTDASPAAPPFALLSLLLLLLLAPGRM